MKPSKGITKLILFNNYEQSLEEESLLIAVLLDLNTLITSLKAMDEVHEVVMEKDFEIYKGKKERVKSIALKAKKESSDDETSTSESDNKEYAMAVRKFKKFFERKGCGDPNHLTGDCPKPSRNKDQKAFIGGSGRLRKMWSKKN
ncbi:hypothetical protein Tco_0173140 [Tanacetum coccineum]